MFPATDPYRKLHHRRRGSTRRVAMAMAATLLVGCAAAAAMLEKDEPAAHAEQSDVIAHLTAYDAVMSAHSIAQAEVAHAADEPIGPEPPAPPARWAHGIALTLQGTLQRNQTITAALMGGGVSQANAHAAIAALDGAVNFRRSKPKDAWEADVDGDGRVTRLRYAVSPTTVWEARRQGDAYVRQTVEVAAQTQVEVVSGSVQASLWQAFERSGADGRLAAAFIDIFAYTIDFATETQRGDEFHVAFESTWVDGERVATGRILGARYRGAAGDHVALRWNDAYYDDTGESVERQFLRSPLATVRITSNYGRRFHPVLGKMKMHAGVDYGAPTGTPVQAVADGKVTFAGYKGANGNLVAIQHAAGYTTYYAHLSKISPGVRAGVRVKKKQLIGKVGSTGRSTGPHLHFGMKKNGAYINPLEVDFERGTPLGKAERAKFMSQTASLRDRLR